MPGYAACAHLLQGVVNTLDPTHLAVGAGHSITVGVSNASDAMPGSEENDYVYILHGLPTVRDGRRLPSFAHLDGIKAMGNAYKAVKSKVDNAWHEQRW